MTVPSSAAASAVAEPLGWRLVRDVLVTHVPVPTLAAAAQAVEIAVSVGDTGGAVDGHLTAEVYPDRAVLQLHTLAVGAVTDHDLRLARHVTAALAERALHTTPGDSSAIPQSLEISIDALDIAAVRPFWKAVTGYVDEPESPDATSGGLTDPLRRGPTIWFQQMDAPRPQRNRIHLDVDVAPEHAQARIDATIAAGGRLTSAEAAPAWWVLADPEGNEACICTWQGRD